MSDLCEWDPARDKAAIFNQGCRNTARVLVGAKGEWRLCKSCAALKRFGRFKTRKPIPPVFRIGERVALPRPVATVIDITPSGDLVLRMDAALSRTIITEPHGIDHVSTLVGDDDE